MIVAAIGVIVHLAYNVTAVSIVQHQTNIGTIHVSYMWRNIRSNDGFRGLVVFKILICSCYHDEQFQNIINNSASHERIV